MKAVPSNPSSTDVFLGAAPPPTPPPPLTPPLLRMNNKVLKPENNGGVCGRSTKRVKKKKKNSSLPPLPRSFAYYLTSLKFKKIVLFQSVMFCAFLQLSRALISSPNVTLVSPAATATMHPGFLHPAPKTHAHNRLIYRASQRLRFFFFLLCAWATVCM